MKRTNILVEHQLQNKKQKLNKTEEVSLLLTLFDTNLLQNIFIQLFKTYKYKLKHKLYISNDQISDSEGECSSEEEHTDSKEEDYKKCFFKISNFKIVCKLFNNVSKETLFNLNIYDIKFKIPYNLYFKLSYVEKMVEKSEEFENVDTMLLFTCQKGFYDIINTLIRQGKANINNQYFPSKITPLFKAVMYRKSKTIKELFKFKNLNVNLKSTCVEHTPLMEACINSFEDIISLLLTRNDIDLNSQNIDGFTPLLHATKHYKNNIVSLLLSRNDLNLNIQSNFDKRTALIHAVRSNQENIVSLLLSRNGLNLNIQDFEKRTALMYAIIYNYENIVSLLLPRNDLDLNAQDKYDNSVLIFASRNNQENIVSLLLSQKNSINLNLKDHKQKTALNCAKENQNQNIIKMIQNYEKKF